MEQKTMTGEELVISGISGKFPKANNVKEYQENLLNGVDCISEKHGRWNTDHPSVQQKTGQIEGISKCDSTFFAIHTRAAHHMEPMMRMVLERAYEAVADAGINPLTLRGSKTGVFMSSSWSDCERIVMYARLKNEQKGFGMAGVSRSMLANRVTFCFGLSGPSYNIDTGCTASLAALQQACSSIRKGDCENAIVGSAYLNLHPHMGIQLSHLGLLAHDGQTKSFDANANGYTLSESVSVLFLQKSCDAKRIYAEVLNVQSMHGPSVPINAVLFPTSDFQAQVMKQTLMKSNLSGKDISYVEADGLGIKDADAREAEALDLVYNEGRDSPLLIGSVKSNIGHASSTNGFNSIFKVLIAMESGIIPKNLHYHNPSELIPALSEGRLQVVTEPTKWEGTYAAINTTSFTGNAAHVILKAYKKKKKNEGELKCDLPRIVTVSGRTKEAIEVILDDLERRPVDVEMVQLVNDIFEKNTPAHLYRGYTLLPPRGLVQNQQREIQHCSARHMEVWFVFSGMGSQWVGMGESLLRLPVFADAVRKCDAVLKPRGFDIFKILTDKDPKMFENIVHSFVGIAAVQIGLVDVLMSIGIKPDFMIGHSVGELGCAYADGCFTAEEMVLSALCRGLASIESPLIHGSMAAVGLSYEEVKNLCPPDIDVACHNSANSSTISGPADSVKKFAKQLQDKGVFAREVACSNIAYHSRYIAPAGPKLLAYLQKVITNPKPRTKRWVCSSVPRSDWGSAKCCLSSAEYHTNNLLSPVLFAESSRAIPGNAIAIEIAPHGLLQAILKTSLPESCINIPLTSRSHKNNIEVFLTALGKLYNAGLQPDVTKFYPKIEYPVGSGTPFISPLIRWDHSLELFADTYDPVQVDASGEQKFLISLQKDEWKFLEGSRVNGKVVIPVALYLSLVWDMMQTLRGESVSVTFENINIHKHQVILPENETVSITVMVQKGSGTFEVTCEDSFLASGILKTDDSLPEHTKVSEVDYNQQDELSQEDVYTELSMRGFEYSSYFMSICNSSMNRDRGVITWGGSLTILLDGMIQLYTHGSDTRRTQYPLKIRKIIIDADQLKRASANSQDITVSIDHQLNILSSNEVYIEGITLETVLPKTDLNERFIITPKPSHLRSVCNWEATQPNPGSLESIAWTEGPYINNLALETLAKVEYATIDHLDLNLTGEVLSSNVTKSKFSLKKFGLAYSGINAEGDRVMGISGSGTLATYASTHPEYTWLIPESWTLEEAATVPLSYAVAYGALCLYEPMNWYSIIDNKTVLILNACSSYGQAAMNVAQHNKWEIFTTYVTEAERQFICSRYPQVAESNIFCSATMGFTDQLLLQTKGVGVDIVFCNNYNLKLLDKYLLCIRRGGHLIFVGELGAAVYESFGMGIFWKEVIISAFIPEKVLSRSLEVRRILSFMIREGLDSGAVSPLHHKAYPREELQTAFSDVISYKNFGTTVIKIQPEKSNQVLAVPRFHASGFELYLIIGGISTFGFELIDFLVTRGARNIVVTSAFRSDRNYYKLRLNFWRDCGVTVMTRENMDLSKRANFVSFLKEIAVMGPIDSIFDLQRVANQLLSSQEELKTMNLGTKILDEETRRSCPHLHSFIICSTLESYAETEEFEPERLCRQRFEDGLPGVLILWEITNSLLQHTRVDIKNIVQPTVSECIEQLDRITGQNTHVVKVAFDSTLGNQKKDYSRKAVTEKSEEKKFHEYVFCNTGIKDYSMAPIHLLS